MKLLQIEPLGPVFFRDGKPFTMAENSFADSIFPPAPSVFRGFLRTLYFSEKGGDISVANKPGDPTLNLEINFFALCNENNELLFPLPADLFIRKDDPKNIPYQLTLTNKPISNYPLPQVLKAGTSEKLKETGGKIYLTKQGLESYLHGNTPGSDCIFDINTIIVNEPKVGIGRDSATHFNVDGKLYQLQMKRIENDKGQSLNFLLGYSHLALDRTKGIGRLGGEGKMAFYKEPDKINPEIQRPELKEKQEYIKMYLATPAIFKEGWAPTTMLASWNLKLIASCVGRYLNLGGWDIVNKGPKPMYRAVPAGSVFYIEGENKDLNAFTSQFHGKCMTGESIPDKVYPKEGIGLVYFANKFKDS